LGEIQQLAGIVYFLFQPLPIGNGLLKSVKFFQNRLRLLVIIPKAGIMRLFLEVLGLLTKPIYLKDTPVAFRPAI
jgi:hypothetical protein